VIAMPSSLVLKSAIAHLASGWIHVAMNSASVWCNEKTVVQVKTRNGHNDLQLYQKGQSRV
jgi:hypothetical protein